MNWKENGQSVTVQLLPNNLQQYPRVVTPTQLSDVYTSNHLYFEIFSDTTRAHQPLPLNRPIPICYDARARHKCAYELDVFYADNTNRYNLPYGDSFTSGSVTITSITAGYIEGTFAFSGGSLVLTDGVFRLPRTP